MSDNLENLSKVSAALERHTDYWGAKLLAFPYSWIPAAVVLGLAAYGAVKLVS